MVRIFSPASCAGSATLRDRVTTCRKPNESPHASGRMRIAPRGSRLLRGRPGRRRRGERGPSRATGTGSRSTCSLGATLPQMAVPDTMKSTRPSWSCWTTSRSCPSVPLGKSRTVTAPPVIASASCGTGRQRRAAPSSLPPSSATAGARGAAIRPGAAGGGQRRRAHPGEKLATSDSRGHGPPFWHRSGTEVTEVTGHTESRSSRRRTERSMARGNATLDVGEGCSWTRDDATQCHVERPSQ